MKYHPQFIRTEKTDHQDFFILLTFVIQKGKLSICAGYSST